LSSEQTTSIANYRISTTISKVRTYLRDYAASHPRRQQSFWKIFVRFPAGAGIFVFIKMSRQSLGSTNFLPNRHELKNA